MKRVFAWLLCLVMALSMIPAAAAENGGTGPEETVIAAGPEGTVTAAGPEDDLPNSASGEYMQRAGWEYADHTLYLKHKEWMGGGIITYVMHYDERPWLQYIDEIRTIVLDEGCVGIASRAFQDYPNLTGITIPNTVGYIEASAFKNCPKLQDIVLPHIVIIKQSTFQGCSMLSSLTIPSSVERIEPYAFEGTAIGSLQIPSSCNHLEEYSLGYMSELNSVRFLGSAPYIHPTAFTGVTATIYTPTGSNVWPESAMQDYGGDLTWANMPRPVITGEPEDVLNAKYGDTVTLSVQATGQALSYQWRLNIGTSSSPSWLECAGATSPTYSFAIERSWISGGFTGGGEYRCTISNDGGAVYSRVVTVTVDQTPVITEQPKSVSAWKGDTVSFSISSAGRDRSFQWYYRKNSSDSWHTCTADGATTSVLTLTAESALNGHQYRCKVSNDAGYVYSSPATLTIIAKPVITTQPKSASAYVGATAKFTVAATGTGLKYQWQYKYPDGSWKNSGYASGKTATLSFAAQAKYNKMQVRCKITDASGKSVTSSAVTLTILPKITVQPKSVSATVGATVKFPITATGAGLTYQWQYKYPDGSWMNSGYASGKTAELSFAAQAKNNKMQVRCKITDENGKTLTSSAVTLTINPKITAQPKSTSVTVGATAKFTVTATGAGLKYQWQYKYPDGSWTNSGYASGKTASLSFAALAKYNKMQYRCKITDANGKTITSSAVTLTITPKITAQPKSITASVGATAKFTVTATGAGLTYQWQYKYPDGSWTNSGYSSAKTATLSVPVQAKYNGIQYRCIITDANGKKLTSSAVTLTVR